MKKILLLILFTSQFLVSKSQVHQIDFGTTTALFSCDPPVYTTTGQSQCISNNPVSTPSGNTVMYYTTDAGVFGQDCRNWLRLSNPGFSFIGSGSELQLRNANGGNTTLNPARFLVKNFAPGVRFGISFDVALAGYGGAFYFRCGSGQAYGDTVYMTSRDSSSFTVMKINATNVALTPFLQYSSSAANTMWPNVPSYSFVSGISSTFTVYQKHTVAIFCNNSSVSSTYNYIGTKILNPQSFDVYLDSILDVDNMFDDFFGLNRTINSFMFAGSDAMCANGGPYLGDTIVVDNIRWTSDFVASPLPVRLSSFNAQLSSGNQVMLSWQDQTPSRQNRYEVQVSTDGVHFSKIGFVQGNDYLNVYSFNYQASKCGTYFFRLSFDNKYSDTRPIDIPCSQTTISFKQEPFLLKVDAKEAGQVRVVTSLGQPVLTFVVPVGQTTKVLRLTPGIYFVQFIGSKEVVTQKVLIQ